MAIDFRSRRAGNRDPLPVVTAPIVTVSDHNPGRDGEHGSDAGASNTKRLRVVGELARVGKGGKGGF